MRDAAYDAMTVHTIARRAGLGEGGLFISVACNTCFRGRERGGPPDFQEFKDDKIDFAGFEGSFWPKKDGTFDWAPYDPVRQSYGEKEIEGARLSTLIPNGGTLDSYDRIDAMIFSRVRALEGDDAFYIQAEQRERQQPAWDDANADFPAGP